MRTETNTDTYEPLVAQSRGFTRSHRIEQTQGAIVRAQAKLASNLTAEQRTRWTDEVKLQERMLTYYRARLCERRLPLRRKADWADFELAILGHLSRHGWARDVEIMADVGGSYPQVRRALDRLQAAGKVLQLCEDADLALVPGAHCGDFALRVAFETTVATPKDETVEQHWRRQRPAYHAFCRQAEARL